MTTETTPELRREIEGQLPILGRKLDYEISAVINCAQVELLKAGASFTSIMVMRDPTTNGWGVVSDKGNYHVALEREHDSIIIAARPCDVVRTQDGIKVTG